MNLSKFDNGNSGGTVEDLTGNIRELSISQSNSLSSSLSSSTFPCEITSKNNDSTITLSGNDKTFFWNNVRLPTFIRPIHYELFMNPDIDELYNRGNVSITIESLEQNTRFIILHIKRIEIFNVKLYPIKNNQTDFSTNINVVNYQECSKLEQLHIELEQDLQPNNQYQLIIEFGRIIEDQLEGFYVSSYFNVKKQEKRRLLTTHFEPTLARSAFPCFDEPAMKGKNNNNN